MEAAKKNDEQQEELVKSHLEQQSKESNFKRILKYNDKLALVIVASLFATINGFVHPYLGIVYGKVLTLLIIPMEYLEMAKGPDYAYDELRYWVLTVVVMAVVTLFFRSTRGAAVGIIGQGITTRIRTTLYHRILEKDIGFFDYRENNASVLTSSMAEDTGLINGASTESLDPYIDSLFSLFGGLCLGFYYCWQMSLVCIGLTPLMTIGQFVGAKVSKGLTNEEKDDQSKANILCGDSILNFKTVQSMGHERLFVKKYQQYLDPQIDSAVARHVKAAFAFGLSQFTVYLVIAACFFIGGLLIENSYDELTNTYSIDPEDVFKTIFAIIFGASHAGQAMQNGPDIAKANNAATNIFRIMDYPSKINAVEQDQKKTEFISADKIDGIIEFKDVWFRYPSRKDDFVLRGLNITINPNESVALVGESGCGKSTFVSLLMRFYDVDFGEILLDGINIKNYNLHSLRQKISLVMQEPSIFNYSILENILYGKLDATNSEVLTATDISNCTDFIDKGSLKGIEDTPRELLKAMQDQK